MNSISRSLRPGFLLEALVAVSPFAVFAADATAGNMVNPDQLKW
jgi:hypothetical protein